MPRIATVGASNRFAYGDQLPVFPVFWISPALTLGSFADNTAITSVPNLGSGGANYAVTVASNVPTKATQSTYPVLNFNGSNQLFYNIATPINLTNQGSLFFVGYQTLNRMIALGGAAPNNGNCFFGWSGSNNSAMLFRNTTDGGVTLNPVSSVAGLKAFGLVKTGNNVTYYDNTTASQFTSTGTGTYIFNKVGIRDYGNSVNSQPSTGVLGDVLYYRQPLSNAQAQQVMRTIKTRYGIT